MGKIKIVFGNMKDTSSKTVEIEKTAEVEGVLDELRKLGYVPLYHKDEEEGYGAS